MKRPELLLLFCFLLLLSQRSVSQDIHFTQFRNTPLLLNPALAGSNEKGSFILNYRDQWKSIGTPYKTFNASADMIITRDVRKNGYFAAGLDVFSDNAGESELRHFQSAASLSYHVKTSEHSRLGAGFNIGYAQRAINYSNLTWGSQFDGYFYDSSLPSGQPSGKDKIGFFDLGAGIVWSYSRGERYMTGNDQRNLTLGAAVFHLNRPDYSFNTTGERLESRVVLYGDGLIGIPNSGLSLVPGFQFHTQGKAKELTFGMSLRYLLEESSNYTGFQKGKAFSVGLYHRTGDAFLALVDLELGSYAIGVGYDMTSSSLKSANSGRGGLEVSLRWLFQNPLRKSRLRS
ncbi:MAG: hypothetical protein RL213_468 [Bacteroidota bacterium]|jgi:type IX secretion system PorP/SprF family membrane protein